MMRRTIVDVFHRRRLLRTAALSISRRPFTSRTHVISISTSTSTKSTLSPGELGKLAHQKRMEQEQDTITKKDTSIDTILSHAGLGSQQSSIDNKFNQPLSPPIQLATTYERPPSGDYSEYYGEEEAPWIYSRMGNPTRSLLEDVLSDLEMQHTDDNKKKDEAVTCVFSSGMAAVSTILLAITSLSSKQQQQQRQKQHPALLHILLPDDVYHGVPTQFKTVFDTNPQISFSNVDMTCLSTIQTKVQTILNDKEEQSRQKVLIWMETPSNPSCKVTDIQQVCDWVKSVDDGDEVRIMTIVDSTWAPPTLTQPLLLGADAVLHSGTKYLGGHSDVLMGTITTSPLTNAGLGLGQHLPNVHTAIGATASPLDCWLVLRGLRTLHLRLERQCTNAMELASFLLSKTKAHDDDNDDDDDDSGGIVKAVYYPGLKIHPQHEIASKQMKNGLYGGMLSFEMENEGMAMAVAGALRIVRRATSLGGTETLIEHRASIEPEDGKVSPAGLLRVSVGLEDVTDLKRDFEKALRIAKDVCNEQN